MKTVRKQFLCFTVFVAVSNCFSCHQKDSLDEKVNYVAELECRAVSLREQRFTLANKLRFAQDSLLQLKTNDDSIILNQEIEVFTSDKNKILQQSLQLADTIHLELDSIRKFDFTDTNDKKMFDQKLKEELIKRGCDKE